jgi:uncharacterized protein
MRIAVRVRPRSARTVVGGRHGDALVVRVQATAAEGRANEAVLRALATSLGVRPRAVRIVSGATARQKVVEVDGDEHALGRRVATLLGEP